MLPYISSLIKKLDHLLGQCFGDNYKILVHQEKFILGELTERALNSPTGMASTHLGFSFFPLRTFVVGTKERHIKQIAEYGEYRKNDSSHHDPKARDLFRPFEILFGLKSVINKNDKSVLAERKAIKHYLNSLDVVQLNTDFFTKKYFNNWNSTDSFQDAISHLTCQIIAKTWYGMDNIEANIVSKVRKIQEAALKINTLSTSKMKKIHDEFQRDNKKIVAKNKDAICNTENYIKDFIDKGLLTLAEVKPIFALAVENNLSTAILVGALCIGSDREMSNEIFKQLSGLDSTNKTFLDSLKGMSFLHEIYLESLRISAPSFPVARFASREVIIDKKKFPAGTFLFAPLRAIAFSNKYWTKPNEFYPNQQKNKKIGFPNSTLSMGSRQCPASFGFTEIVFKVIMYNLFVNYDIKLKQKFKLESHLKSEGLKFSSPIQVEIIPKSAKFASEDKSKTALLYKHHSPKCKESSKKLQTSLCYKSKRVLC